MLRFKNELREKDLIFAFVHQESAHIFPLLNISMRQKGAEKIELDVTVRWKRTTTTTTTTTTTDRAAA